MIRRNIRIKVHHTHNPVPWSKLQREIYKLVANGLDLRIHCVAYRMGSQYGSTDLPRYWFQIGKETIWDYPKDFLMDSEYFIGDQKMTLVDIYPYDNEISAISNIIREYIDTPKEIVFEKVFERDKWGLTDMLKASDRRIGKERLKLLNEKSVGEAVHKIIAARLADGK